MNDDILLDQPVRADADIDRRRRQPVDDLLLLRRRPEPAEHLDPDRERRQPLGEGDVVLLGEHGGRHEHGHLPAVHDRLESRPDGHLRLAVADVPADEPVHRLRLLHVLLDLLHRLELVGRLDVGEGGLELLLPDRVRREGEAGHDLPRGVEGKQLPGQLLGGLFGPLLGVVPFLGAEPAQHRRPVPGADVPADAVDLVGGDVKLVAGGVLKDEVFPLAAAVAERGNAGENADAVLDVDDILIWGLCQP